MTLRSGTFIRIIVTIACLTAEYVAGAETSSAGAPPFSNSVSSGDSYTVSSARLAESSSKSIVQSFSSHVAFVSSRGLSDKNSISEIDNNLSFGLRKFDASFKNGLIALDHSTMLEYGTKLDLTDRNVFIFSPSKSLAEIYTPIISPIISLLLGWGFSAWMYSRTRKAQIEDREDARRLGASDEFWFRKTIFPMVQQRVQSYCKDSLNYWQQFKPGDAHGLRDYLEYSVQAEHHNLLLMMEHFQPTVCQILTENIVEQLIEILDELETLYTDEFPTITEAISNEELSKLKQRFKEKINTIEYRILTILNQSLEASIQRKSDRA